MIKFKKYETIYLSRLCYRTGFFSSVPRCIIYPSFQLSGLIFKPIKK